MFYFWYCCVDYTPTLSSSCSAAVYLFMQLVILLTLFLESDLCSNLMRWM